MSEKSLVGEVLSHVDVDDANNVVMLTTVSGRQIKMYHDQDCCESVRIEDTSGDWHKLVGKPLIEASLIETPRGGPPPEDPESWTRTEVTFKVDDATVITKWIGESNGCYSESVDIEDISEKF